MHKRVLITGTSHGLGLALLRIYAAQDDEVIAVDRHLDPVHQADHPKVIFKVLDITDKDASREMIRQLAEAGKLPDVIIFNAATHVVDNDPFIDFHKFSGVIDVNMMSIFNFLACLMPVLNKPATFVFCSSGVIIFPNPANLGYYLSKLAVTKAFDHFTDRYSRFGFRFKSVILGPMHSRMLSDSPQPAGAGAFLRTATTSRLDDAAEKIVEFINRPGKRMYYLRSSAVILWLGRTVQCMLPAAYKFYQVSQNEKHGK